MVTCELRPISLTMFDGEGGSGGEGVSIASALGSVGGQTAAAPVATATGLADAGQQAADLNAEWAEAIAKDGKFRTQYQQAVQKEISRRMKNVEGKLAAQEPLVKALQIKYGTDDIEALAQLVGDDDYMLQEAADNAGLTVEQYRQLQEVERQRDAAQRQSELDQQTIQLFHWMQEAAQTMGDVVGFDLVAELDNNPQFEGMLKLGVPIRTAWDTIHPEQRDATVAIAASAQTAKQVADNIRARGARPAEGPIGSYGGVGVRGEIKPSTMTGQQVRDVVRYLKANPNKEVHV